MKACLEAAGRRLHSYPSIVYVHEMATKEMELLVETLRGQIASKLVAEDVPKFDALLEAAFGKTFVGTCSSVAKKTSKEGDDEEEDGEKAAFKVAVKKAAKKLGLVVPGPYQMGKIIQLHEQLQSRFGVVLIGPSGSGKTTIWKLLAKALELQQQGDEVVDEDDEGGETGSSKTTATKINIVVIGPKVLVPKSKLFGYIDEDTREWHDGLFSSKARAILRSSDGEGEVVASTTSSKNKRSNSANSITNSSEKVTNSTTTSTISWLIFDGDIDPDWVEALNSVLDDNRVLTLPSGERIDFDLSRTRILFETTSLANASPATISRLGVVSVDATPEVLFQVVDAWNNSLSKTGSQNSADELPPKTPALKNSNNVMVTVSTFLRTNASTVLSPLSTTRTLLEHISFATANGEDEGVALDRMTGGPGIVSGTSSYRAGRRRSSYIDESESLEVSLGLFSKTFDKFFLFKTSNPELTIWC